MSDRVLLAYLTALGDLAGNERSAVFSIREDRPHLEAATSVDQAMLDSAHFVWSTRSHELRRGGAQPLGAAVLLPLRDRSGLAGLLYVDPALKRARDHAKLFDLICERLRRITELPRALRDIGTLDTDPDQILKAAMIRRNGNVSAVARALSVSRQTIYERLAKLGWDPGGFRTN